MKLKKDIPIVFERNYVDAVTPVLLDPQYGYASGKDKRRKRRSIERQKSKKK